MKQNDVVSILFTAVIGLIAGASLYVMHFSKLVAPDTVPTETSIDQLTIVSESYGSCGNDCPSFQVVADGSYRYQYAPSQGAEKVIKSGTLPLELQYKLKQAVTATALTEQSQPEVPADCNSRHGAIDIRYNITLSSAVFGLDSCGTTVDDQSDLWVALSSVWNYFATVQ
jgi:hypothetical protein